MPLSEEFLEQTVQLCGECVGQNLYTKDMLETAIQNEKHKFYLLVTPKKETVAYIYFILQDIRQAEQLAKHSFRQFCEEIHNESPVIGDLQSIGVHPQYRKRHLSEFLIKTALNWLWNESEAEVVFGVCWKIYGSVPMEKTLKKFGFLHLTDVKNIWYDRTDLYCPVCKGRCRCDAAIYYRILERKEKKK